MASDFAEQQVKTNATVGTASGSREMNPAGGVLSCVRATSVQHDSEYLEIDFPVVAEASAIHPPSRLSIVRGAQFAARRRS